MISHLDVNNTISNGLFHVWCGKYPYDQKKKLELPRKKALVNIPKGCEKSVNFK